MLSLPHARRICDNGQRRSEMVISVAVILLFVIPVVAFAVYALVKPFTHVHYSHPSERLWRPLD
jgi:TRAP-type mannitol/chloroaromatic compound transport system permease small subunit